MTEVSETTPEMLAAVAFVGETLGPLFLEDPQTGGAGSLLEAFADTDAARAAADWPFGNADAVQGALSLMVNGLAQGVTDDLVWEYRRLFVGPQTKVAPPWGSVYTDHDRVAFGASERELRRWMREVGITLLSEERDPADHIGRLLSLMAWIARNKPGVLDDFLRLHVLTWSSHFLNRVEEKSMHAFYRGLAQLTRESLEGIQGSLGITVDYPRFYQ